MTDHKSRTAETPDDDPRGQDYEAEWEQLDEKVILAQILAEQQRTNMLLEKLASDGAQSGQEEPQMYECRYCNTTVKADERQRHAESEHKAPADKVESLFTEA